MHVMFKNKPAFTQVDPVKIRYNVGSLFDIPTGQYVKGRKGENIMNGGLGPLTAIGGRPNTFKSKVSRYLLLAVSNVVFQSGKPTYLFTHDTESNVDPGHALHLTEGYDSFKDRDIIQEGMWIISDNTKHSGNEWYTSLKNFLRDDKIKNRKDYITDTPFIDKNGTPVVTVFPTVGELDSLTELTTDQTEEVQSKNQLGDSAGNMIHAQLGLAKTRMLMELPGLCSSSGHYMIMTAHIDSAMPTQQGPISVPVKQMQHMKSGEKFKGVASKFLFLTNATWQTLSSSVLKHRDSNGPLYPRTPGLVDEGSTDLNLVTLKLIRNKSGPSGITIDLIISQDQGVLPTLSEFHFIRESNRYGLDGNNTTYSLTLYPAVKIGRTTIREAIEKDPLLCRAIKITADLLQIKTLYKTCPLEVPDVKALFDKLDKQYGWDVLLKTRDYWTFNQYEHPVPFLSTYDLLEMYYDRYIPYWFKKKG